MEPVKMGSAGKVLLTGGSGFIASHILDQLLAHESAPLVKTVTAPTADRIAASRSSSPFVRQKRDSRLLPHAHRRWASYVVVEDITKDGAFDTAVQSTPPFDYVIHTASPYHLNPKDPLKDFLDPAIKGTNGILNSIKAHAPTVKRVVITSSSAAILNPKNHAAVYDERSLELKNAYKASKIYAERAAWDFVSHSQPNFSLSTICNTYTFGPIQRHLTSAEAINASNHRIRDMLTGKMRSALAPTAPVFTFVDVRDVALAHVRALTVAETGRFYIVGEHFSNKKITDILKREFPEVRDRLLPADAEDDFPEKVYGFDNSKSKRVLGIDYTSLEKSVRDTAESMLDSGLLTVELAN